MSYPSYLRSKLVTEWLTINDLRHLAESGTVPVRFRQLVQGGIDLALELGDSSFADQDRGLFFHADSARLPDLWTFAEMQAFADQGTLPEDFDQRAKTLLADENTFCLNCDGRQCMGCVMREWDHRCSERSCPDCCC